MTPQIDNHPASADSSCRFCEYFHSELPQSEINTPWLRTIEYAALVSVGAFVPGWSLVCPTSHQPNMASLYKKDEFWAFAADVENIMRREYGDVSVFEHGAIFEDSPTNCGTGHAHLHLVPLRFSLQAAVICFDEEKIWVPCAASEIEEKAAGKEYLFVSDKFLGSSTTGLICVLEKGTSQFFRRVIATHLGLPDFYNYRTHPMSDIAVASVKTLIQSTDSFAKIHQD